MSGDLPGVLPSELPGIFWFLSSFSPTPSNIVVLISAYGISQAFLESVLTWFGKNPVQKRTLPPVSRFKLRQALQQVTYQTGGFTVIDLETLLESPMQKRLFFFRSNNLDPLLSTASL